MSVVQFGRVIGSDVRSEAQSHRRPRDKDRIAEGMQSESARQAVYSKRCYIVEPTVQRWMIDQTGRVPFLPIYLTPTLRELSSNISLETSRKTRNLPDTSRLFRIVLVSSPTQRSSPSGLIGTCVGSDSPCAAVLARRLIGKCEVHPQTAASSQLLLSLHAHWQPKIVRRTTRLNGIFCSFK